MEVRIAKYFFKDHGKSIIRGEVEGFVKLIADAEERRDSGSCGGRTGGFGTHPRNSGGNAFPCDGGDVGLDPALSSNVKRNLDLSRRRTPGKLFEF